MDAVQALKDEECK